MTNELFVIERSVELGGKPTLYRLIALPSNDGRYLAQPLIGPGFSHTVVAFAGETAFPSVEMATRTVIWWMHELLLTMISRFEQTDRPVRVGSFGPAELADYQTRVANEVGLVLDLAERYFARYFDHTEYYSFPITNTKPWPDEWQPGVWTDGQEVVFAAGAEELRTQLQRILDETGERDEATVEGWREMGPDEWLNWGEFDDVGDVENEFLYTFQVAEVLLLGRLLQWPVLLITNDMERVDSWNA